MADLATFVGPHGQDAPSAIRMTVERLSTITSGDLIYVGQVFRSRIRERTLRGVDVNGAPFTPYSSRGPYYFYPNRESAGLRTAAGRAARATAARNRHTKTGKLGQRTPFGIRYESYGAAKAAHGVGNVNLYGMEQHTHMLDTMIVKVGAREVNQSAAELSFGSELEVFEQNQAAAELTLGFYGLEELRARGNNEGTSRLPQREFFALDQEDLQLAEQAIGERIEARAQALDR